MREPVVIGRDVWKLYGTGDTEITALRAINIEISRGEMLAIMGPSGCGKTTLLNCFSGLDEINRGQIWLEGVDLHSIGHDTFPRWCASRKRPAACPHFGGGPWRTVLTSDWT
jgi:putative ABC transport system ATP-binding protein